MATAPVPFDREVQQVLDETPALSVPLTPETLPRGEIAGMLGSVADQIGDRAVEVAELRAPGPGGEGWVEITLLRPAGRGGEALPLLVNLHGGGMVIGHRNWEAGRIIDLVLEHGVAGALVEYRLAPEHPFPAGIEDCYAAFVWLAENAVSLGCDSERIVVMGGSAGGGLTAAVALAARERGGPVMRGQLMLCPMLDNTDSSVSSLQYDGIGTWQREANEMAWRMVLGDRLARSEAAPALAAPARATDLSGLPDAYIELGAAEMFRDEDVDYASRIWAAGGQAELHVWAGGCHGFDMYMPDAEVSRAALAARSSWLRRVMAL